MNSSISIDADDREDPEEEPQAENPQEAVYYNDLSVAKDINVSDLLKIITQKGAKENEGFLKEFKSLPYGERFNCLTAKLEENLPKNRFKTTFPYDHSRVVLEVGYGFTSDYINANYIENMDGQHEYIACQAPREYTLVDHWRMIWQEHVEYIVMLTNLIEGPKVKSYQYWPEEDEELDIKPFRVKLMDKKVYAYFVIRRINVQRDGVNGSRTIVQFHYTKWPDHGTPNPIDLLTFLRHFRHQIQPSPHPIIVHCSAGVGRTGTFIALDVLSRYGEIKRKVNIVEFVKAMRRNRMTMIQNSEQYIFLYHALYEFFRRQGQFIGKDTFLKMYGELDKPETRKDLANDFNALTCLRPKYEVKDFKTGQANPKLNRTQNVLPVEKYLAHLTSSVKGRGTYYNAVFVSSFTQAEEFISAQYPVTGAAIDLVRLLVDHESSFLVCLNSLTIIEELKEWAEREKKIIELGPYKIAKVIQTTLNETIRKTRTEIQIRNTKEKHVVQIFECLDWSLNEPFPAENSSLTDLIKHISLDRKSCYDGHITVLSKDGASCCGVFIAVYNAIQQLQLDNEVDMFTIVQQLHCRRPEMISTKEEYEFCFKSVCNYLCTDCTYANT
ncbi:receptor-type tyrosine-protein phosphatase kappa-like [Saccostrea echinata]|uniref:receptor-type tyrosine-protein phosphatase kappa-like n=1 Tax=Saccostrea echinata TaxID=191078 RepID=UPI002A812F38|nr:receptor-type tyrosine-protein phosphatase kappa-like [Saccostrea echinata]